jgi:spermidine/putrescine transport system substrate-binding protein
MKKLTSTQETLRAAMISRRRLIKAGAALGAVGLAGPLYVKNAFSSSGELNLLMWSDALRASR